VYQVYEVYNGITYKVVIDEFVYVEYIWDESKNLWTNYRI